MLSIEKLKLATSAITGNSSFVTFKGSAVGNGGLSSTLQIEGSLGTAQSQSQAYRVIFSMFTTSSLDLSGFTFVNWDSNDMISISAPSVAANIVGSIVGDNFNGSPGNDTADGGDGNDSLNGVSGNDILLGGKGADTLYGGNGNDTLDGGNGTDNLNGAAGDDVIFYNATDNLTAVLGGADTDTLVFTSGPAPTTFNLTAHEFERAEGRFTDTGVNPWSSIVDNYDSAWRKTHQTGLMDSGQTYFEDYDELGTETWTRITYWNDALGRPDVETGQLDDGRVYDSDIDNGNLYTWTRIDYWRDALGHSDVETGYLDDGRS